MSRRRFLVALGLATVAISRFALADPPSRLPTVGMLWTHVPVTDPDLDRWRNCFHELGYEEGRNLKLVVVSAEGHVDRLPELANELINRGVDVIITSNDVSTRAAQKATTRIPIVMSSAASDPVSQGFVTNLRRPEGNITGSYSLIYGLEHKRLEVLKEAVPQVARVGILRHPPFGEYALPELVSAGKALKLQLEMIEIGSAEDLTGAFQAAKRKKVGGMLLIWSPMFYLNRDRIAALALEYRMPIVSSIVGDVGAFITYGSDRIETQKRSCYYADRLLKGAKPSELPVEEISTLRLTVNLRAAKALGISIPESVLMRADEVVQ
jgi:putative tryptophan/tyrosine transport system substrate-binding protein